MQINGAIVQEQDVTYAIVTVKPFVMKNKTVAKRVRANCSAIQEFKGVPIVLAVQESREQFIFQGRRDIVNNLAKINPARLPWKRYTFPESVKRKNGIVSADFKKIENL
jgi:hypothetical protein